MSSNFNPSFYIFSTYYLRQNIILFAATKPGPISQFCSFYGHPFCGWNVCWQKHNAPIWTIHLTSVKTCHWIPGVLNRNDIWLSVPYSSLETKWNMSQSKLSSTCMIILYKISNIVCSVTKIIDHGCIFHILSFLPFCCLCSMYFIKIIFKNVKVIKSVYIYFQWIVAKY